MYPLSFSSRRFFLFPALPLLAYLLPSSPLLSRPLPHSFALANDSAPPSRLLRRLSFIMRPILSLALVVYASSFVAAGGNGAHPAAAQGAKKLERRKFGSEPLDKRDQCQTVYVTEHQIRTVTVVSSPTPLCSLRLKRLAPGSGDDFALRALKSNCRKR